MQLLILSNADRLTDNSLMFHLWNKSKIGIADLKYELADRIGEPALNECFPRPGDCRCQKSLFNYFQKYQFMLRFSHALKSMAPKSSSRRYKPSG